MYIKMNKIQNNNKPWVYYKFETRVATTDANYFKKMGKHVFEIKEGVLKFNTDTMEIELIPEETDPYFFEEIVFKYAMGAKLRKHKKTGEPFPEILEVATG